MKLTKKKFKEFVKLIMDCNPSDLTTLSQCLDDHPELVNMTITGMAKGIDGFSVLQLSIRFFNFEFAEILVKRGADVNYIDDSDVRYYHYPLFFDLLEMMTISSDILNSKPEIVKEAIALWDLMKTHGLDYHNTTPPNELINAENCLGAAIRLIGASYRNKHRVHSESIRNPGEPYVTIYKFSEESRDMVKEVMYRNILEKLIADIDEAIVDSTNCARYRTISLSLTPFYKEHGYVDDFGLEAANDLVFKKYGRYLPNYRGSEALRCIGDLVSHFAD